MTDLYISYSMRERHWVSKLVKGLESEGYSVWWDHVAVLGDDIRPDSQVALESAKQVIAIWSPLAIDDDWVLQDAKAAQLSGKLVSVFHKSAILPSAFSDVDVINLKHWQGRDAEEPEFKAFLEALKTIIEPSRPSDSSRKQALKARRERMLAQQQKQAAY
ncbi:toll/interleukin-1 receptor domain-containing protein [Leucothrix sargassi]|nr:toll/interleukin-1 receptor domain-containing protein [Leucothrix sargassi]